MPTVTNNLIAGRIIRLLSSLSFMDQDLRCINLFQKDLTGINMADGKSGIKEKLLRAAAHLKHGFIKAKHTVKESLHLLDPVMIMPYYGYGNDTCVYLKGRVIEKEKVKEKKEGASTLRHLKNTNRRYESDEIPGIRVRASYGGKEMETQTDDEGFFAFAFRFDHLIAYEKAGNKMRLRLAGNQREPCCAGS